MPLGFQERFTYGQPMSAFGNTAGPATFRISGAPLIGYEAFYGYRSGKSSKFISTQGSYSASVLKGRDLRSQLEARKQFLERLMTEAFVPQNGAPSVFSTTDTGHPFASFKVSTHQPYGRIYSVNGPYREQWDVIPSFTSMPYPLLTDPFGAGVRTDTAANVLGKQTYFTWPSPLIAEGRNAPAAQQVVPNGLKQTLGAGLIAGTNPWKSKADLAVTIGELMTGNLPRILSRIGESLIKLKIDWKLQTGKELGKHTNPGNEWLSLWFGWAPLVRDITAAIEVLYKLHVLLYDGSESEKRRFQKGSLVDVSRIKTESFSGSERILKFATPMSDTLSSPWFKDLSQSGVIAAVNGPTTAEGGKYSKTVHIQADFRFTARFHRGALPNAAERGYLEKALELLGLDITPATVYQLAPWTWLLDWFSSLGSAVQNLSILDWSNVLLDYAYLTLKVETSTSTAVTLPATWAGGRYSSASPYISQHTVTTEKIREQASPLGFSVSWNGLTPFQLSILAALGMTRGR